MSTGETHLLGCGTHYSCDAAAAALDHSGCPVCGGFLCDGISHAICEICSRPMCNGIEHGMEYGQCGYLNTSALVTCPMCGESTRPDELHLGECNVHYICQTGDSWEDHAKCYYDDHGYVCDNDGMNHRCCYDCGWEFCTADPEYAHTTCSVCGDTLCYNEVHEICSICGLCIENEWEHGTEEGQCGYQAADQSALMAVSRFTFPLQGFVAAELIIFLPFLNRKRKK